ncbi:GNAT family N-acetyltransferase [Oscillatoria sp. FACHB-1407]|uniref:GNAT family N-acetyltransferase n=1 Tax=Oscillatoria sp. FACHB-1407 TaxID=2692847 RepID=UPI0016823781|nr:GNAT family N-acetyltransferase [Oscillatoria sp. FACHB-1407]MBD2462509.1 GNAT family N-acetyltransferase [Oscillatoria sp. FACHB-1407]
MKLILRPGRPEDALDCGSIGYEGFRTISSQHNFPNDFPNVEAAIGLCSHLLSRSDVYSVVAELDGHIAGSNFLWEGNAIAGVGPITVDPKVQNASIGKQLMQDVLKRAQEQGFAGVRLLQAAYHNRSLSLYTKLGFATREPISVLQGKAIGLEIPGYRVRPATATDLEACNRLCYKVHGHDRHQDVLDALQQSTLTVVEYSGCIVGYSTMVGYFGHTVAEHNNPLKALIGAATSFPGPGFLLPTRNSDVFRWCLQHGLRVVQPLTLMSLGLYNEPVGAYLPSIIY